MHVCSHFVVLFFFFQAEDGIRDWSVTGVQTCALPIRSEEHTSELQAEDGIRLVSDWSSDVCSSDLHPTKDPALGQLYRDVRGQGLSLDDLAMKTAESHATEDDHQRALVDLVHVMDDFRSVPRTTPAARANHAKVAESWLNFRSFISAIPDINDLADYCRAIEGFRKVRPSAAGNLK